MTDWKPLYVSAVIGGPTPENRAIRAAVKRVARSVGAVGWTPAENQAGVDVEFHVAGNLLGPDYEGMRTGRWSKKNTVQVVQIAVPTELEAREEDEVVAELLRMLSEAVELAAQRLADKRIKFDLDLARSVARKASSG